MAALIGVVLILGALNVVLVIALILLYNRAQKAEAVKMRVLNAWEELKARAPEREAAVRKDAIARSTSVVKGKVAEHLVPWMKGFPYNPRDCRFLGAPVDFVVFEGLTEGDLERIVLVEIKTGASRLSKRERQIRDAVQYGEYAFLTGRVLEDGSLEWES